MGCHLGWHFTVGCPLRGGRGKCKIIGTSVPPKTIKKKKKKILYLPGLKNVVADFSSRPNKTTAGSVAATSAADPVDFEEMAAEQNVALKRSVC
jgi:hypothetical protein